MRFSLPTGIIVDSNQEPGFCAVVSVRTDTHVPNGAKLTIPDVPETGGCGLASPVNTNGVTVVKLEIGYSYVDDATIGK
jgi:hypothetical protein